MKCFTNCSFVSTTEKGKLDFKVEYLSYISLFKILEKRSKDTKVIGLDTETFASAEVVYSREFYTTIRKKEYVDENKNPETLTAKKKIDREYDLLLKEVALNPRLNTIRLVQINTGKEVLIFDLKDIEDTESLFKLIQTFSLVIQNCKFDVESIKAKYSWFEPKELFDTMIAHKIYKTSKTTEDFRSNLFEIIKFWCGVELNKEIDQSNWGGIITDSMLSYSYYDVRYLLECSNKQIKKLNKNSFNLTDSKPYFNNKIEDVITILEMKFLYPLIESELKGYPPNVQYLKGEQKSLQKEVNKLSKPFKDINFKSPIQLKDFLHEKGVFVNSTAKGTLLRHKDVKIIKKLLLLKMRSKALQMASDYVDKWLDPTDRIYSDFRQIVGATGRMSSTQPNSQQIHKNLKDNFYKTNRKKYTIIKADYPSIEARIAAVYCKDERLLNIFSLPDSAPKYKRDMHIITAAEFYGVKPSKVTDKQRGNSKPANFGLMYGMGIQLFMDYCFENFEIDIDEEESRRQHDLYYKLYAGVRAVQLRNGKLLRQTDQLILKSILGRSMAVDKYTNANNYPIQSTGAEILKLACVLFYKKIKENGLDAYIINYIHDEIIVECKTKQLKKVKKILKKCMEQSVNFILKEFKTTVDIEEVKN